MEYEVWTEEFTIHIRRTKHGEWISETIAIIPFDSENRVDREDKARIAEIIVDALNESKKKRFNKALEGFDKFELALRRLGFT
jgi:hypothetical protein